MKNCSWIPTVMRYHDDELTPSDRRDFETHLADCPECQQELQSLAVLSRRVTDNCSEPMPGNLRSEILQIPRRRDRTDMLPMARALASAAAILLVFSIGFSSKYSEWSFAGDDAWSEALTIEEWDSEALEEPEAEMTHWVVAGLSEPSQQ